jgi:DNA-binding transcriptional ArsR family regulator
MRICSSAHERIQSLAQTGGDQGACPRRGPRRARRGLRRGRALPRAAGRAVATQDLHTICLAEQSVGAVVAATGLGQTNVSRQLAQLHHAGVVSRRKIGNSVSYQVADPVFVEICRTACVQIAARIDARTPLRDELLGFAARHPTLPGRSARRQIR